MKGSRMKTPQISQKLTSSSQKRDTNPLLNQSVKIEEEFISNLQKQIYYLELEMKLMKDKEIETKNKVGGYEILFRDGVPLNEHFLALKTKYTNEKDQFEHYIMDLDKELNNIENENKFLSNQIDETNKNYFDIIEKYSQNSDYYQNKTFDLLQKLINETNSKESHLTDKEILNKTIYKFTSENVHHNRTIEKNKLFKENREEKNKILLERNDAKFQDVDKLVTKSLLEQEMIERKIETNSKGKIIETENASLIMTINKLERDLHMAQAKVKELENIQILNKKYLLDEELTKRIFMKENQKLNDELDSLVKINEDVMKLKVKENETNQSIIIKNSIANNELRMNHLLNKFKEDESRARELLEEKNGIAQQISVLDEVIESQLMKELETKREIIDVKNAINELEILIEDNKILYESLNVDNDRLRQISDRNENDIKSISKKLEEIQQKIELNQILKEVDLNELKLLSQNNALVNHSINSLMSKWDKVQTKLDEMEK